MYLSFYGLDKKPFQINTDPNFLWLSEIHKEALSVLSYGVMSRNGVLTLTGDIGTGKTTLINALLAELNSNITAAHISYTSINIIGFLNLIGQAFQIQERFDRTEDFIYLFSKFLHKKFNDNCHVLLVIDEAHRLSKEILEQIRLLSNIEMAGQNLTSFFLVGQNELNKKLLSPECRALRQRITIHYQLQPLSESDTLQYCNYRLYVAGNQSEIFNKRAIQEVYRFSKGYPRLINIICEQALISGYVKEARKITPEIINECSRDLRLPSEKKMHLKLDFFGKLSPARKLICKLDLGSKIRVSFHQLKKATKLLSMSLYSGLFNGGLCKRLKSSIKMEYYTIVNSFSQSEKYNNKSLFLKVYGLKRKIHNFISGLTDSGFKQNTLTVGSIILALILSLWYWGIFLFESNPGLSENFAERSKLKTKGLIEEHSALPPYTQGVETAEIEAVKKLHANLRVIKPDSNEKKTKFQKKIYFNQIVDPIDYINWMKLLRTIEEDSDINQPDNANKDEKVNPGKIMETESSIINSVESQLSAKKFAYTGKQDKARSNFLRGFSNPSSPVYSVQIGAFLSNENAIKRSGILRKKGYLTNIVKFRDVKGRLWYTVRLGNYDSLNVAKNKAEDISSKENLETTVRLSDRL